MDIVPMVHEILVIANPVIRESSFPDFSFATEDAAEGMRIAAFDQLNGMFERYVVCGSEQQMDMFGHEDEGVNLKPVFSPISIKSFQE